MANRSRRTRTTRLVRRAASAASGAVFLSLVTSTTALAVPPNPSPDGSAPGAALMNTVLLVVLNDTMKVIELTLYATTSVMKGEAVTP